jgi:basic membrane lipoprotein Med (substrate-binding protein (PBP1-ABC) superfamily)
MGQYGNQPDFGTAAEALSAFPTTVITPSAVYIGAFTDPELAASITVRLIGNNADVTFSGLNQGTFLPIIVTKVTSAVNIPAASIILYR